MGRTTTLLHIHIFLYTHEYRNAALVGIYLYSWLTFGLCLTTQSIFVLNLVAEFFLFLDGETGGCSERIFVLFVDALPETKLVIAAAAAAICLSSYLQERQHLEKVAG